MPTSHSDVTYFTPSGVLSIRRFHDETATAHAHRRAPRVGRRADRHGHNVACRGEPVQVLGRSPGPAAPGFLSRFGLALDGRTNVEPEGRRGGDLAVVEREVRRGAGQPVGGGE